MPKKPVPRHHVGSSLGRPPIKLTRRVQPTPEASLGGVSGNGNVNGGRSRSRFGTGLTEYIFEVFLLLDLVVLLLLQNFNIYLWNTDQYSFSLVGFTTLILGKRIGWKFLRPAWNTAWSGGTLKVTSALLFKLGVLVIPCLYLVQSGHEVMRRYDWRVWLYLAHPLVAHLIFFGNANDAEKQWILATPPYSRPDAILANFKKICLESSFYVLECVYYVGLMPLKFITDDTRHYSRACGIAIALYGLLHIATLFVTNVYQLWWKELHEQSCRLGSWGCHKRAAGAPAWTKTQTWSRGSIVRYKKKGYIALGQQNLAEPGHFLSSLFWTAFAKPTSSLSAIVVVQVVVIVILFVLLLLSTHWHVVACWTALLLLTFCSLIFQTTLRRSICKTLKALETEKAARQRTPPSDQLDGREEQKQIGRQVQQSSKQDSGKMSQPGAHHSSNVRWGHGMSGQADIDNEHKPNQHADRPDEANLKSGDDN